MKLAVLGIDLGKNSCSLVGLDQTGAVVLRRRLRRDKVEGFVRGLVPCVVAMEACCGAHYLGRALAANGHEVRLMSPEYVRPYVKAQKNDDRDAEAIAEAATRPTMRFVTLKSEEQLDVQTLHRVRDRLVAERTALTNQRSLSRAPRPAASDSSSSRRALSGPKPCGMMKPRSSRMLRICWPSSGKNGDRWMHALPPSIASSSFRPVRPKRAAGSRPSRGSVR